MLIETIEISLEQVRKKTQAIRFILKQNQSLRDILFTNDEEVRKKAAELKLSLSENSISITEWKIYEHSAVVVQLYATYENFVEKLIRKWLEALPQLVTKYDQLEEVIRKTHRIGVCKLISTFGENRYDLKLDQIIQGLSYGINKKSKYKLIPESFLINSQNNLREGELKKLFGSVGLTEFESGWKWLKNHQNVKEYIDNILGESNTLEKQLDLFIEYRNASAHSLVQENESLGYDSLLNLCDFVDAICQALADLLIYHFLNKNININKAKKIGEITNYLSNRKVLTASVNRVTLSLEDTIFIVNPNSSYCKAAIIRELRNKNGESKQVLRIIKQQDISLQIEMINVLKYPKKNQAIYVLTAN
ncbi:MAE_28990/MAE_18760 family HEPN-like nuclease [Tychonema sp. BBK16]|uniref:MAE_28990/MAE_18760 family HEPN-like nuclease n=1 Tax=Tychonema sp. BBK16 TaxID=2699888 RepID=UPI001EEA08E1|nr:MAE_28990/MAE_18760 family HEPN-like nuclease [Tychonema sp. BBK16]MCF6371977.1 hypothetical protein [Tychonema sp. BBK16]